MKINQKNKYIFVDYFDTTCFRHIHSFQIYHQWAKCMLVKIPELEEIPLDEIVDLRHRAHHIVGEKYEEAPYCQTMEMLYELLEKRVRLFMDRQSFVEASLNIDISIEIGCQYGNLEIIRMLRKEKAKGKKIFLVSDFYLPGSAYDDFLINIQCQDLFDKVYISESCNHTKASGSLYRYILEKNHIEASEVVMIGDSKHADVKMARAQGLDAIWYFPLRHKLWTNYSRITKRDFAMHALKSKFNDLYHHSTFAEYAAPLCYFSKNLSMEMAIVGGQIELNFFSRGGYFMKKAFDAYQTLLTPIDHKVKTFYFLNSRKVVFLAKDAFDHKEGSDARDYDLQKEYLLAHSHDGKFFMVDEGWYNHSQQALSEMIDVDTYGYYIGSCRKEKVEHENRCHRKGLLFEIRDDDYTKSPYFGIFCTNRSMYEQLLSAPHGSVRKYKSIADGMVEIEEKYDEREMYIYERYTRNLQEMMLVNIKGLAAWHADRSMSVSQLANLMLKSALFNNRIRCRFLNDLDRNMVDNFAGNQSFLVKGIKDVRINPVKLFLHPAEYLGMMAKVQRKLVNKPILLIPYYILASMAYCHIRIIDFLRYGKK